MISVIIPSYNAENTIGKCLEALKKQSFSKRNYEIIVVDDASKDRTAEVVKKFKGVKLIRQKHRGPAAARNLGVKNSRGDVVLFTDSDCIPDKKWIKNMAEPFKDKEIAGVSGTYKTLNKESLLASFIGYEIKRRHEELEKKHYIDSIGTFSGAYKKDIFSKSGGFDASFSTASGEDPELSYRIVKAGYKLVFNPKAFVWHPHPSSFKKYFKQQFWRGWWRVKTHKYHMEEMIKDPYITRSLFFEILMTGLFGLFLIFALFEPLFLYASFTALILEIISSIKFSIWVGRDCISIAIVSPIIILIRNICFTAGFILSFVLTILRII